MQSSEIVNLYKSEVQKSSPFSSNAVLDFLRGKRLTAKCYLDIGGATGLLTRKIADSMCSEEICVVDVSEKALEVASYRGLKAYKVDVSRERLPFPDNHFDLITMIDVLEHLVNTDNALEEAHRVLRQEGYILISTPNLGSWRNRLLVLFWLSSRVRGSLI